MVKVAFRRGKEDFSPALTSSRHEDLVLPTSLFDGQEIGCKHERPFLLSHRNLGIQRRTYIYAISRCVVWGCYFARSIVERGPERHCLVFASAVDGGSSRGWRCSAIVLPVPAITRGLPYEPLTWFCLSGEDMCTYTIRCTLLRQSCHRSHLFPNLLSVVLDFGNMRCEFCLRRMTDSPPSFWPADYGGRFALQVCYRGRTGTRASALSGSLYNGLITTRTYTYIPSAGVFFGSYCFDSIHRG